ncbi:MAG: FecR domain-containing protein [Actinomycetota bacterium]
MGGLGRRLGWRRLLPVFCVLAIGAQLGPLTRAQEVPPQYADLTLDKNDRVDPVAVTNTITYDLRFSNRGPDDAYGMRIVDELPPEVEFLNSQASHNGVCTADGSTVTCAGFNPIADDARGIVHINVTATAATPSAFNTAEIFTDSIDYEPRNNNGSERTHINVLVPPSADLYATKSGPAEVTVEDTYQYWLRATNNGPNNAQNVTLTDVLPSGVEFVAASGGCAEVGGTVTCTTGSVSVGQFFDAWVEVRAKTVGSASNSVSASSDTDDPDGDNNESAAVATEIKAIPVPEADVSITKTGPANATNGGQFTYGLTVTNSGPDAADDVTVTDLLPSEVSFVSASDGCSLSEGTVTCELGPLAPGSRDLSITVEADESGQIFNTASVTTSTVDTDSDNNTSDTVLTDVAASADLSMTKSGPADVETGDSLTYTLNVANAGPDAAEAVTVSDDLPPGLSFESSDDDCEPVDGTVTCSLGTIADGGSASASFEATAQQAGPVTNEATVSSSTGDPNSGNNGGSATTQVTDPPDADVTIAMTDSADPVTDGDSFSYKITIDNNGPDAAQNVKVVDTLPAGLNAGTLPAGCSRSANVVTCDGSGSLAKDATPLQITIPVVASGAGTRTNKADVTWNASGQPTQTASATQTTTVDAEQVAPPPPPPQQNTNNEEEALDACPTAARSSGNPGEGLLAFVPAAVRLEQERRRRLTLVDGPNAGKRRSRSKIFKIAGIAALLAAVAVVGVLFMTRGGGDDFAKLGGLEGRVDLAKQGDSYKPAAQAAGLDVGDKVRTGVDGLARIDYSDGSLTRLDHNTTFKVAELVVDETHKSIKTELDAGRIWNRVEKLTKPGDRFEVKTVTAVATVQGTTFVNDCRFNGGRECSHIGIEGLFQVITGGGDEDSVAGGQCKTEEGQDIGECRFTEEELENDPFLIKNAKLDGLEKGDVIVLPEIFGDKQALALFPDEESEEETQVQGAEENPTTPTESTEQTTGCPTGEPASRGTSSPVGLAAVLLLIFFGIAWARPNRKSTTGPTTPN